MFPCVGTGEGNWIALSCFNWKNSSLAATTTMFVWVFEVALITRGVFKLLAGKFTKQHNSHEQSWKQEVRMSKWAVRGCHITGGGGGWVQPVHCISVQVPVSVSCLCFPASYFNFHTGLCFHHTGFRLYLHGGWTTIPPRIHTIWYRSAALPKSSSCPGSFGD